jgi:hypothetical protein
MGKSWAFLLTLGALTTLYSPVRPGVVLTLLGSAGPVARANKGGATPQSSARDLAGAYYFGDGEGVNCHLKLSHDGRYQFRWHGCLGLYDQNHGTYRLDHRTLVLSPERPNLRKPFQGTPTRFQPIRWGPRLYLIPDEELLRFCNSINEGIEPRNWAWGMFYLRDGDEKKPVGSVPDLPHQWQDHLLPTPIEGKVTGAARDGTVTINMGKKNGLMTGMVLVAHSPNFVELDVTAVNEATASARVSFRGDRVRVGSRVSTQLLPRCRL